MAARVQRGRFLLCAWLCGCIPRAPFLVGPECRDPSSPGQAWSSSLNAHWTAASLRWCPASLGTIPKKLRCQSPRGLCSPANWGMILYLIYSFSIYGAAAVCKAECLLGTRQVSACPKEPCAPAGGTGSEQKETTQSVPGRALSRRFTEEEIRPANRQSVPHLQPSEKCQSELH